jgi:ATP-dependent protease Clp ATPase subunit
MTSNSRISHVVDWPSSSAAEQSYRPPANLPLLGPTGSGKTRLLEAVAEVLFGDPQPVVKIDCADGCALPLRMARQYRGVAEP